MNNKEKAKGQSRSARRKARLPQTAPSVGDTEPSPWGLAATGVAVLRSSSDALPASRAVRLAVRIAELPVRVDLLRGQLARDLGRAEQHDAGERRDDTGPTGAPQPLA